MAGLGEIALDEVVHFDVVTHNVSTGAVSDADSTPTFSVFEEDTDTPIVSASNFTKRTALTGNYRGSFTASAANGFEVGKWYNIVASATVNSVAAKAIAHTFRIIPAESSAGVQKVDLTHISGSAVSTSTAQLGVNVVNFGGSAGTFSSGRPEVNTTHVGGTSQTARDLGASVLISSGTGTGQLSVTSGVIAANVTQFGGSAGTFASGRPEVNATHLAGTAYASADLSTTMKASVNTEVDTALTDIHLDHLIGVADPGSIVANNSLWAKLSSSAATATYADYDHTTMSLQAIGAFTQSLDTVDLPNVLSRLPAALVSGRMDSSVGAMAANTLTASALATDAVTEIQSGLSTLDAAGVRTAVGLATANLDTQLDALPTAIENADAILSRGVSNVQATADTTSLCTVVLAMLESSISGTTWTIRKTDGTTFVTKTLTTAASADSITGVT